MPRLVARSLRHYRRSASAVALGVALATAVITGSLLVGDSVRLSLRERALARLGRISWALTAPGYFRAGLAPSVLRSIVLRSQLRAASSLVILPGSARNAATDSAVPTISLVGIDTSFSAFEPAIVPEPGSASISRSLASELGLRTGDDLLFSVGKPQSAPGASLYAATAVRDTICTARVTIDRVLPDDGLGGFSLDPGISTPRNIVVNRAWLAERLGRPGMANVIVMDTSQPTDLRIGGELDDVLRETSQLPDAGLSIAQDRAAWMIRSTHMVIPRGQVDTTREFAQQVGARVELSSVFLATTVEDARTRRSAAYAVVASTDAEAGPTAVRPEEIALNKWAADDLAARVGDTIRLEVLEPASDGTYHTRTYSLRLARIIEMQGPGADRSLPPDFQGITSARRIGDWNPPFPVDRTRVTSRDERYWDLYRAAPRAYLHPSVLRAMWQSGSAAASADWVTGIRVPDPKVRRMTDLTKVLPHHLTPSDAGLAFRPVRAMALRAAEGSTEFGGLFVGMGMFLVGAGAWLAGSLMRLLAERRAAETGILLALGFTSRQTTRLAVAEGAVLCAIGAPAGGLLGVAYGALICHGLGTWWNGALGGESLRFHLTLPGLLGGVLCGFAVGMLATAAKARALPRMPVLRLLSGWAAASASGSRSPGRSAWALIALVVSSGVLAAMCAMHAVSATAGFFGIGALLLIAALPACDLVLMAAHRRRPSTPSPGLLAIRNASVQRGHSLLTFGLTGCAAFILVTVAANVRDLARFDVRDRSSGAGGFSLIATSTLPIAFDFGSPTGRARLGFAPEDERVFRGTSVVPFLLSPGDDVSCLNPARPVAPRILGVPPAMVARGGFRIATRGGTPSSAWGLLGGDVSGRIVPAFVDSESAEWVLKSGLGQIYMARAGTTPLAVRFDGLVASSIFAGEILISEDQFRRVFPTVAKPRYFLIETPPGAEASVAAALRRNLGDRGLEVHTTREKLNALIGVQNAYLSAFMALGGLGLALGTLGLAAALARSAQSRRKEFATMAALGFTRGRIATGLIAEHAALLLAGLAWGAAVALLAVAPHLRSAEAAPNWLATSMLLASVGLVGLGGCAWAGLAAVRGNLVSALRSE